MHKSFNSQIQQPDYLKIIANKIITTDELNDISKNISKNKNNCGCNEIFCHQCWEKNIISAGDFYKIKQMRNNCGCNELFCDQCLKSCLLLVYILKKYIIPSAKYCNVCTKDLLSKGDIQGMCPTCVVKKRKKIVTLLLLIREQKEIKSKIPKPILFNIIKNL